MASATTPTTGTAAGDSAADAPARGPVHLATAPPPSLTGAATHTLALPRVLGAAHPHECTPPHRHTTAALCATFPLGWVFDCGAQQAVHRTAVPQGPNRSGGVRVFPAAPVAPTAPMVHKSEAAARGHLAWTWGAGRPLRGPLGCPVHVRSVCMCVCVFCVSGCAACVCVRSSRVHVHAQRRRRVGRHCASSTALPSAQPSTSARPRSWPRRIPTSAPVRWRGGRLSCGVLLLHASSRGLVCRANHVCSWRLFAVAVATCCLTRHACARGGQR